jgi:hypothetical protein
MSDPTFHCKYCQEGNFSEEEMIQHLLNQHDQEVRADYPPTENPFYSHKCHLCSKEIQDNLRCDKGHDCIKWHVTMGIYGSKLGALD